MLPTKYNKENKCYEMLEMLPTKYNKENKCYEMLEMLPTKYNKQNKCYEMLQAKYKISWRSSTRKMLLEVN